MNKKRIAIVSLDSRAGESYGREVTSLFGNHAEIAVYNVQDGSAMGVLPRADLFVVSTDAYGSAEEVARHVPMDCPTMAVEVSFRWSELRKLKEIPAFSPEAGRKNPLNHSEVFLFILGELYTASEEGRSTGREKLLEKAQEIHLPTSQQEIRNILAQMAENGLARVSRGRGGSRLTLEGRRFWEEHLANTI